MKTIQVVVDEPTLKRANRVARTQRINRSALIRRALAAYFRRLDVEELEARDRAGYDRIPEDVRDVARWERVQAWPED